MTDQAITAALDETLEALMHLDEVRLEAIEARMEMLKRSKITCDADRTGSIVEKSLALTLVLHTSEENLNALRRLHDRNAGNQWAR